jgi:hypothetical protein
LLELPPPEGWTVNARFHLTLTLDPKAGPKLQTPTAGVPFSFAWRYPDSADFAQMRARLRTLLQGRMSRPQQSYMLGALFRAPGVGDQVSLAELLAALRDRTGGMDGRDIITKQIADRFVADPRVQAYYLDRVLAKDGAAVEDLLRYPALWHTEFLRPLVVMAAGGGERDVRSISINAAADSALAVLAAHRGDWSADVPARLSAGVLHRWPVLTRPPHELTEPQLRGGWQYGVSNLGLTGDPAVIPLLAPFLDVLEPLTDPGEWAFPATGPVYPGVPLRACDVALDAILTILGDDLNVDYRDAAPAAGVTTFPARVGHAEWREFQDKVNRTRDLMISQLKQRLQRSATDHLPTTRPAATQDARAQ